MENFFGHAFNLNNFSDENKKERIAKQIGSPAPAISSNYYYTVHDILEVATQFSDIPNRYSDLSGEFLKYFNDNSDTTRFLICNLCVLNVSELYKQDYSTASKKLQKRAFNNFMKSKGYSEITASTIEEAEKIMSYGMYGHYIVTEFVELLKEKYDLMAGIITHPKKKIGEKKKDVLLICYPEAMVKTSDNKWTQNKKENAAAQFFGTCVALGLIDERFLDDNNIMLGTNHRKILSVIEELKNDGVEKIFDVPLHQGKKSISR